MFSRSIRQHGGEWFGILFAILGSLVLLIWFESSQIEIKWLVYFLVCLLCGVVIFIIGNIQKTLLVILILSLQIGVSLYLTEPYQTRVGTSGPTALEINFITIPAIILLIQCSVTRANNIYERFFWGKEISYYAALWLIPAAFTILYTSERSLAAFYLIEQFQLYLVFFVIMNTVKSQADIALVVKFLMITLALQSLVYFSQNLTGSTFTLTGELYDKTEWDLQRHGGTVSKNPAPFACFILPLLFIAISRFLMIKDRRISFRMGLLAIMGSAALVLTFTRGAWMGFILGLIWLVPLGLKRRLILPSRLVLIGIVGLVIVMLLLPQIMMRMSRDHSSDYDERFALMRMAWEVIQVHPVLGVGAGAYAHVFRDYLPPDLRDKWLFIVHNAYLLRWAETGIFGLLSLFLLLFVGLRLTIVCTRIRDETIASLALGASAGLVALMCEMWWNIRIGTAADALVWLLFGVLLVAKKIVPPMPSHIQTDPHSQYAAPLSGHDL
jgi:O-antigen ligase